MNSPSVSSTRAASTRTKENIKVYVRVRPLNEKENSIRSNAVIEVSSSKDITVPTLFDARMTKLFSFDQVFGPEAKQPEVYQCVIAPLIKKILSGRSCTVFAYGQTATGKTHTMIGTEIPDLKSSWEGDSSVGIIPRTINHLFDEQRLMTMECSIRVSYLELYNEELCDLLSSGKGSPLKIYDDSTKKGSVIIHGLEEIPVHSKDDVYKLLKKGQTRRKTATTLMNARSSRSHTIFSILLHVRKKGTEGEEMLKFAKLNLVDLAGSENISKAGIENGIRSRETVNMNKSLLALGRAITALAKRSDHIPFRESKLTRILQESLSGIGNTAIIATVSPGRTNLEVTLNTLEYAHRAKYIRKPSMAHTLTKRTILSQYIEEIDRLKRDLIAAKNTQTISLAEETYKDMQYKIDSKDKELNEKVRLIGALKDELNEVRQHLDKVLLNCYVKKKFEPTGQAEQLISVADEPTEDAVELQIETRKAIDSGNLTACQQFTNQVKDSFGKISENLENLDEKHKTLSDNILKSLRSQIASNKKMFKMNINYVSNIEETVKKSFGSINECIKNYKNQLGTENRAHEIGIRDHVMLIKNSLKTDIKTLSRKKEQEIKAERSIVLKHYDTLLMNVEKMKKTVEMHVDENSVNLSELSDSVQRSLQNASQNIQATNQQKEIFIEAILKLFDNSSAKVVETVESLPVASYVLKEKSLNVIKKEGNKLEEKRTISRRQDTSALNSNDNENKENLDYVADVLF